MLGVTNSLVLQNKVDLVKREDCVKHYRMLQTELKDTIAQDAPVIPISAQSEILIDVVIKHLLRMCRQVEDLKQAPSDIHGFTVVRSFDVNKPDTQIAKMNGGVVGGSVIGNEEYSVGDDVEIRPGLIRTDGTFMVLKTKILGIRSEKKSVGTIARGGLFALGTKLDPAATRSDRLVGCLVGRPDQLPDVVNQLTLRVFYMKKTVLGDKVKKISVGYTVKLVIGNTVVRATCIDYDKKKKTAVFSLQKPICIYMNKCLVYTSGRDSQLVAYSDITDKIYKN
jgi:translation initiation factor 2 subunit 3